MLPDPRVELRRLYQFRCGYCGTSELDVGAPLTTFNRTRTVALTTLLTGSTAVMPVTSSKETTGNLSLHVASSTRSTMTSRHTLLKKQTGCCVA